MTDLHRIIQTVERLCEKHLKQSAVTLGRPKTYSDTLILQLCAIQYLQGFTSEEAFFRWLRKQSNLPWFSLPSRSQYNRRVKELPGTVLVLLSKIVQELELHKERLRIIDSAPVPVIGYARSNVSSRFIRGEQVNYGYCSARHLRYFGYKLHLITNKEGIPVVYHLGPANRHDLKMLPMLAAKLDRRTILLGDKGYLSSRQKEALRLNHGITLVTPMKKNQIPNSPWEKRILRKRRSNIDSTFAQLKDHLGLERLGAKSCMGIEGRVAALLFAYCIGVRFNRRYRRPPRAIKSILL